MSRPSMILPVLETTGRGADEWRDGRLPRRFAVEDAPTPVGHYVRSAQCPEGRHLWDLLRTIGDYRGRENDEEVAGELAVRLVGTCVRCGVIWRMEGTDLDKRHGGPDRVNPEPLRAGGLLAQEVDRNSWYGDIPRSTYSVHGGTDPAVIGWISWGQTRRGREFYTGRLTAWPTGQVVEAPNAAACLRKLAKGGEAR